ncbi:MAG: putative acetyltransferase [Nocardioides sp.]|nr:putative acetyltransferase [Nocardioides sp.]
MVTVSTDPALLDVDAVHRWLSTDTYWAIGRSREVVERAIAHSLNFGAYDDGTQVGYARVITDRATFAWLCDVYVDPSRRGAGVGTALVGAVTAELAGLRVRRAMLATADAHEVYTRFGFTPLADPGMWMARSYEEGG